MGTSSYLPSFDDDGTSDFLGEINDITSKIVNEEILKKDVELMKEKDKETLFWNKWFIANCAITSLKHGAMIYSDLYKKAISYYKSCLADPNLDIYLQRDASVFRKQINHVLDVLSTLEKLKTKKTSYYYAPFLKF